MTLLKPAACWVGVRWVPGHSAVVLMYHRVADISFDPWRLAVSPANFAEQMDVVCKHFNPVPLAELTANPRSTPRSRTVAVTFDDGYRDSLEDAKPVLERYGIPATVFVASGYVGSSRDFWWDELERICFTGEFDSRTDVPGLDVNPALEPGDLYLDLWQQLRSHRFDARRELLDELEKAARVPPTTSPNTMTTEELAELADGGLVEIGGHTVNHPSLPMLSSEEQYEEIHGSRIQLEQVVGRPVTSFCHPHGDFTRESAELVREAGYERSCVSVPGPVRAGVDPFQIPRRRAENWRGDEFGWHLSRFFR